MFNRSLIRTGERLEDNIRVSPTAHELWIAHSDCLTRMDATRFEAEHADSDQRGERPPGQRSYHRMTSPGNDVKGWIICEDWHIGRPRPPR